MNKTIKDLTVKEQFMLTFYASNEKHYKSIVNLTTGDIFTTVTESDSEFQQRAEDKWKEYLNSPSGQLMKIMNEPMDPIKMIDGTTVYPDGFVDNNLHQDKTVEYWEELLSEHLDRPTHGYVINGAEVAHIERGLASAKAFRENDPQGYADMHNITDETNLVAKEGDAIIYTDVFGKRKIGKMPADNDKTIRDIKTDMMIRSCGIEAPVSTEKKDSVGEELQMVVDEVTDAIHNAHPDVMVSYTPKINEDGCVLLEVYIDGDASKVSTKVEGDNDV